MIGVTLSVKYVLKYLTPRYKSMMGVETNFIYECLFSYNLPQK